jgi:DnaK suppressor protein
MQATIKDSEVKQRLLAKREELLARIGRGQEAARDSTVAEVQDSIDRAISTEDKEAGFQDATQAAQQLHQVEDALERISAGRFGICLACGRTIDAERLEALPWAAYCLADQQRIDHATSPRPPATL